MTNAEIIQSINRIEENDRLEKAKTEGRNPKKGQTLKLFLVVVATILILTIPAVLITLLVEEPSKVWVRAFTYVYVAIIIAGLVCWRQWRIARFLAVKNTSDLIDFVEVSDPETVNGIIKNDALVFGEGLNDKAYCLIYNWLKHREVLRGERLKIYTFTGRQLREAVAEEIEVLDQVVFYAIRLDEINFKDNRQGRLFADEHFYVGGGRWLSDMINGAKVR